ncbi:hypothetical protein FEM48_Zijuj07G0048400 [Ziziphus jujuba var. spinosa]|uniref:Transposase MuDR plant domain-containing protein n=1 Tax=Ziziphus jujuba var. spinosa TaxID=714518 RepID=A0A978V2J7_ZIZJJ|nr:hypothetical protein FEM48_Zijuj07G0048400 [Ziziphus jujuba var. spinosa]
MDIAQVVADKHGFEDFRRRGLKRKMMRITIQMYHGGHFIQNRYLKYGGVLDFSLRHLVTDDDVLDFIAGNVAVLGVYVKGGKPKLCEDVDVKRMEQVVDDVVDYCRGDNNEFDNMDSSEDGFLFDDKIDDSTLNEVLIATTSAKESMDEENNQFEEDRQSVLEDLDELKSLDESEDEEGHDSFQIVEDSENIKYPLYVGMKFPNQATCREHLVNYSIANGYNLRFAKSVSYRLINAIWLSKHYFDDFRMEPKMELPRFQEKVKMDLVLDITWNPESTCRMKVADDNGKSIFKRIYICLATCKEGFKWLKSACGGMLLSNVGRDSTDKCSPLHMLWWSPRTRIRALGSSNI